MKKAVFGGFCLLGGIALWGVLLVPDIYFTGDSIVQLIGIALSLFGFVLGIQAICSDGKNNKK